jgi:hypothetical protein
MEKHFELKISDKEFTFKRREKAIQDEAALDGIYVIRTSVPKEQMTSKEAVTGYKSLSSVERAFRSMKSVDLKVRPIHHFDDDRIRSHVFLCMLAYYTEWHMRQQLKELLFDDEEIVAAQEQRASVVAAALRSESAQQKDASKVTSTGLPVQSFQDLLKSLSTQCRNTVRFNGTKAVFIQLTETNPLQRAVPLSCCEGLRPSPVHRRRKPPQPHRSQKLHFLAQHLQQCFCRDCTRKSAPLCFQVRIRDLRVPEVMTKVQPYSRCYPGSCGDCPCDRGVL